MSIFDLLEKDELSDFFTYSEVNLLSAPGGTGKSALSRVVALDAILSLENENGESPLLPGFESLPRCEGLHYPVRFVIGEDSEQSVYKTMAATWNAFADSCSDERLRGYCKELQWHLILLRRHEKQQELCDQISDEELANMERAEILAELEHLVHELVDSCVVVHEGEALFEETEYGIEETAFARGLQCLHTGAYRNENLPSSLIIIDPLTEFFPWKWNENDSQNAKQFMTTVKDCAEYSYSPVLLVHHTVQGGNRPRGSSVFWNSSRCAYSLEKSRDGVLTLTNAKRNDGLKLPPIRLAFVEGGGLRVVNVDGSEVADFVLKWFKVNSKAEITLTGLRQGQGKDAKALIEAVQQDHPDAKKTDVGNAAEALLSDGKLAKRVAKATNGKSRELLEVVK